MHRTPPPQCSSPKHQQRGTLSCIKHFPWARWVPSTLLVFFDFSSHSDPRVSLLEMSSLRARRRGHLPVTTALLSDPSPPHCSVAETPGSLPGSTEAQRRVGAVIRTREQVVGGSEGQSPHPAGRPVPGSRGGAHIPPPCCTGASLAPARFSLQQLIPDASRSFFLN